MCFVKSGVFVPAGCFTGAIKPYSQFKTLLTASASRDHISPGSASLHQLPIKFRIPFKSIMAKLYPT